MKTYKEYLEEALITFGPKAYPKFGNIVILAGGAGSGKGFVLSNLLGIEGKVLDVDHLKKMAMGSVKFAKKVKDETGYDMKNMDLKKPDNVSIIHQLLSTEYGLDKKVHKTLFKSIVDRPSDRKPNIIFDVTLKNITKLHNTVKEIELLGYDKKNIHIVWVVNDVAVAQAQNKQRNRIVPEDILMDTHKGAARTMADIINMGDDIKKYMDGSITLAFNKVGVDSDMEKSSRGGSYIKKTNYVTVKEPGKSINKKDITNKIKAKILSYIPKDSFTGFTK